MYCTIMYNGMEKFGWDEANRNKNWIKHKVAYRECEEIFFDKYIITYRDTKHSESEKRYGVLGKTAGGRLLHVTFTVRDGQKVRVISARDANKKERKYYEVKKQKNTSL